MADAELQRSCLAIKASKRSLLAEQINALNAETVRVVVGFSCTLLQTRINSRALSGVPNGNALLTSFSRKHTVATKTAKKTTKKSGTLAKKSTNATKKASKSSSGDVPIRQFAGYPTTVVFAQPGTKKETGKKALEQLLWGDYVGVRGPRRDGWVRVCTRHVKEGWVRETDIRKDRMLEVIFVDIGQGDGSLVVTPDDKHILIDGGQSDNFIRFLHWRIQCSGLDATLKPL